MSPRLQTATLMIPKRDNWRWVMRELATGLEVDYWLDSRTKSGNWLVGISSARASHLSEVQERAIEKLG